MKTLKITRNKTVLQRQNAPRAFGRLPQTALHPVLQLHRALGNQQAKHMIRNGTHLNGMPLVHVPIQKKDDKVSQKMGMRIIAFSDGRTEVTCNRPWTEGSGAASTVIGMAHVTPGITTEQLTAELVASGAYANAQQVREKFIQGTRIVVKDGQIQEVSVRGKVYKAGGVRNPDFEYFLKEGARIFPGAGFGLASGSKKGMDKEDGYDSSQWVEKGARGTIQALIPAWTAMDNLVKNIGKDVPKKGGGTTKWHFDCFEASQLLRIYAIFRTTKSQRAFNRKYSPLKLGFFSGANTGLGDTISSQGPNMPATKAVGCSGGICTGEVLMSKSIVEYAQDAPVGSWITFGSKDIANQCAKNPNQPMCDFQYENSIKLGKNKFFAHPLGVVTAEKIFEKMALAAGATPGWDYYRANIFISSVRYPKGKTP